MGYKLEGRLLEVCNCEVLCPCWIGEDADNGTCEASVAYHFDKGEIDGVDVSGLTLGFTTFIPGNVLDGNWRVCLFVGDNASKEQEKALLSVHKGEKGGPVADVVRLIGELVDVKQAPITFEVHEGKGKYLLVNQYMQKWSPTAVPVANRPCW